MMGLSSPKKHKVEEVKPRFLSDLEFGELFVEFLEPLFQYYLFLRRVYPKKYFIQCTAYSVPVFKASHLLICEYVSKALQNAKQLIIDGKLDRIALVLYGIDDEEKKESLCINFSKTSLNPELSDAIFLKSLFREALFQLEFKCGSLDSVFEGVTFQIEMFCSEDLTNQQDLVLVDDVKERAGNFAYITPLKSIGKIKTSSEIFLKRYKN